LAIKPQWIAAGRWSVPEAGVVVFDEAHELEDVAADYFGVSVSNVRVENCCAMPN